jgi:hypothetical protein
MLKVTAVSETQIKGEYIGQEIFSNTSDLLTAVINRPGIQFFLKSYDISGVLVCERYTLPLKRSR